MRLMAPEPVDPYWELLFDLEESGAEGDHDLETTDSPRRKEEPTN